MELPLPLRTAIELGLQALLKLDPETQSRLNELDGKTIAINLTSPTVNLVLAVVDGRIFLPGSVESSADTTLTGSLAALRSLASGNDAVYRGEVIIEGNVAVGQQLKEIFAQLDPDWEALLSPVIGDTLVHRTGIAAADMGEWIRRTQSAMTQNAEEYLQEEAEVLAPNALVKEFCLDVDELRACADRLDARLKQLEKTRQSSSGEGTC